MSNLKSRGRIQYTKELGQTIVDAIANGMTYSKLYRDNEKIPCRMVLHSWLNQELGAPQSFAIAYDSARVVSAEHRFEEVDDIVEDAADYCQERANTILAQQLKEEGKIKNPDMLERHLKEESASILKMKVDAKKWQASRLNPKRFSDRHIIVTGDGDNDSHSDRLRAEQEAVRKLKALPLKDLESLAQLKRKIETPDEYATPRDDPTRGNATIDVESDNWG